MRIRLYSMVVLGALLGVQSQILQAQGSLELISAAQPKSQKTASAAGDSSGAVFSADGRYVVFASSAPNLVPNQPPGTHLNLFLRDLQSGTSSLLSAGVNGTSAGNGDSHSPALSSDGRYVAFHSRAQNLVWNPTSGVGDVYLRDLWTNMTTLVSAAPDGYGGNGISQFPFITSDGRYVVYESTATNLVTTPTTGQGDIYLWDRETRQTKLLSVDPAGNSGGNKRSWNPQLSDDGRYALFETSATNLVSPATGLSGAGPILRDLVAGTNFFAVLDRTGKLPLVAPPYSPVLSPDGRFMAFLSVSPYLTADSTNQGQLLALYWRDLGTRTSYQVTAAASTRVEDLGQFTLGGNGQMVAFTHTNQVHLWNASDRTLSLLSTTTNGLPASGASGRAVVSQDGTSVVFISNAPDLVTSTASTNFQVYRYDTAADSLSLVSASSLVPYGGAGDCSFPTISADGRLVAFDSADTDLVRADANRATDVFVRNLADGSLALVSQAAPLPESVTAEEGGSLVPDGVSADGRYVLFTSISRDLVTNAVTGIQNVYLRDRQQQSTILISANASNSGSGDRGARLPVITPDGRFVAFVSRSGDLVATGSDTNGVEDVYVRDVQKGITTLVSIDVTGTAATGAAIVTPRISADGRYVAFVSRSQTLATNAVYRNTDLTYVRDLQLGTTQGPMPWESIAVAQTPLAVGPGPVIWYIEPNTFRIHEPSASLNRILSTQMVGEPEVSPDGSKAFFWGKRTEASGTFVDLTLCEATTLTNRVLATFQAPTQTWKLRDGSASRDGRYFAFTDPAGKMLGQATNGADQIYLADSQTPGLITPVSVNAAGTALGNGASVEPSLSADGRLVAFRSWASDLVEGVTGVGPWLYVRDLETGITRVIEPESYLIPDLAAKPFPPSLSADGTVVGFASSAQDWVGGDLNGAVDVFAAPVAVPLPADPTHQTPPSDWLIRYFGPSPHDSTADSDGDGMSDWAEYVAGTNPTRPASTLRVEVRPSGSGTGVTLSWTGSPRRSYEVQYKASLDAPAWMPLQGNTMRWQSGDQLQIEDVPSESGQPRFYRIVVTL